MGVLKTVILWFEIVDHVVLRMVTLWFEIVDHVVLRTVTLWFEILDPDGGAKNGHFVV